MGLLERVLNVLLDNPPLYLTIAHAWTWVGPWDGPHHGVPSSTEEDVLSLRARPWSGPKVLVKNISSHGGHSMPQWGRYAKPRGKKGHDGMACPRVPYINLEKAPGPGQDMPPCHVERPLGQRHAFMMAR